MILKTGYIFKMMLLLILTMGMASCFKNDHVIEGDAKIKFYNTVLNASAQDFYLNGIKNMNVGASAQTTTGVGFGSNTNSIIIPGNVLYTIGVNNSNNLSSHTSVEFTPAIGSVYSAFYTKNLLGDSTVYLHKDEIKPDTSQSKLLFLNLGYTLGSKVNVRDSLNTINITLAYGEKSEYFYRKFNGKNKIYVNLVDSVNVVDTLMASNFYKGKVYTILFNGSTIGKLNNKIIAN